jgi:hypothetical protein
VHDKEEKRLQEKTEIAQNFCIKSVDVCGPTASKEFNTVN